MASRKKPVQKSNRTATNSRPIKTLTSTGTSGTEGPKPVNVSPQSTNAYQEPTQYFPIPNRKPEDLQRNFFTLNNIVGAITIFGIIGTAIWNYSKLDSKVDYIGTDLTNLKSKTEAIQQDVTNLNSKTEAIQQDVTKNVQKTEGIERELNFIKTSKKK